MESNDKINNNENEYNNLKPTDFQDLTPIDDVDLTGYKEALDRAFNDDKIKNIAITGSYGSGKSSILNTYKKDSKLKFIHISFLHFKECDKNDINTNENKEKSNNKEDSKESKDIEENKEQNSDNKNVEKNKIEENTTKIEFSLDCGNENKNEIDKDKIREAVLERKIINHIINQIPFKYISDTNFNVRGNIGIVQAVTKVLFGIAILYVILFFTDDKLDKLFGLFKFIDKLKPYAISIYILLYCSIIYILIYSVILFKKLRWKNIFKKLNFKNIELDLDKLSNDYDKYDSFFDRYLNEILYVFENCKADVIVFEDIDRFEMGVIFERLREINLLLNEKLKHKDNIIKFCYLMRDDIFGSEDRVKFFDFVIPIMPIMNNLNVYDTFNKYLIKFSEIYNITIDYETKKLMNKSSYYITNMRVLKNIYNEFLIYYRKLNIYDTGIDYNKILALIIYKNLFPGDFNKFNLNDGFLFNIFNYSTVKINIVSNIEKELQNKKKLYNQSIKSIFEKLKENNNKEYNETVCTEDIEIYILYNSLTKVYLDGDKSLYLYGKFNSDKDMYSVVKGAFINENKEFLNKTIQEEVIKLRLDILENEYNIECIKNKRLKDIPDNLFEKIFYKSANFINHKFSQREYDFLIYLIKNFIDERSISFTIDNFKENSDNKFLLNIFIGKEPFNFNYKLIDVENVLLKCNYVYYIGNKCILNFDLLDKLISLLKDKNKISLRLLEDEEDRNKLMYFIEQLDLNLNFAFEYFYKNKIEKNTNNEYFIRLLKELKVEFILDSKILNNYRFDNELLSIILKENLYKFYYKQNIDILLDIKDINKQNQKSLLIETSLKRNIKKDILKYYLIIRRIDYMIVSVINENDQQFNFYNKCSDYDIEDVRVFLNELKNDDRINENKRIEIQWCIDELDKF